MSIENVKYRLDQGWPDGTSIRELEKEIIRQACRDEQFDLVVNAFTGSREYRHPVTKELSDKFKITMDLVSNYGVRKMLFFNFVEPLDEHSTWYEVLDVCRQKLGQHNIKTMGFIDTNKFKQDQAVPFWAIQVGKMFKNYTDEEIAPVELENVFLCYNRNNAPHRERLYEQFNKHGLLHKGIFTLGNPDPAKVVCINNGKNTQHGHDTSTGWHTDPKFRLPSKNDKRNIINDTHSLGPLDAWNSSFLIIVNETEHNLNTGVPFLTEKIYKPLIGMRPFLCLGDKGTIKYLQEAGFHTFNEFFGSQVQDLTVNDVVALVKRYKGNPTEDYSLLKDKLVHNRKRFFEYVREQSLLLGV
jgi:hypothetical protein